MDKEEMMADAIKYCLVKAKTNNIKDVFTKISKALNDCEPSKESVHECIILLKVLEDD